MRKKHIFSTLLVLALLIFSASAVSDPAESSEPLRGVWVSSVYNIDYPSAPGLDNATLKQQADTILDNIAAAGLNAVFLQVRPSADALYPSTLFPWSSYLTGAAGQAPEDGFDPLQYWVDGAHARGLQLHAWINPYRVTKSGQSELDALPDSSPAKQHPEWLVKHEENYYFNPGLPAVQQLVIDGAAEIVRKYDVDGIHLDDYFYPGTDFADEETFARYGADFDRIEDWRRDNVNTLIAGLDKELHRIDPDLAFGVSPAGIWDNKRDNPAGSDTNGRSSYREIYCDTLEWIRQGTVDYICPQLYWSIGFEAADFAVLTEWWQNAVADSDVKLYIGLGAYRAAEAQPGDHWYGMDELSRQLTLLDDCTAVQGEIYFSYSSLLDVPDCLPVLSAHYTAQDQPTEAVLQNDTAVKTTFSVGEYLVQFITSLFCR